MGGDDGAVEGFEGLGQGELILCADLWGFLRDEFGNVLGAPDQLGLPGWLDGEKGVSDCFFEAFTDYFRSDHGFVKNEFDFGFRLDGLIAQGESGGSEQGEGEGK